MDRHGRQARLAEVGSAGQARLRGARVDVRLAGHAAEVAVRYLAGAGVGYLRVPHASLADAARAVDPQVAVEVDVGRSPQGAAANADVGRSPQGAAANADVGRSPQGAAANATIRLAAQLGQGFDLRDPAARDVAAGAAAALRGVRAALGLAPDAPEEGW
jgi:hypothetical protein